MSVDYNSPKVTDPTAATAGEDLGPARAVRDGQPGVRHCAECPWRAGANENTVFSVSHDVQIEGQPLPAGSYGLFMIPGADEWTVIFSKNHTSWGSYFYKAEEDQLRVKVKPVASEYHQWLTYEFTDRGLDKATATLKWELLAVP